MLTHSKRKLYGTYRSSFDIIILQPVSFITDNNIKLQGLQLLINSYKHLIRDYHNWIYGGIQEFLEIHKTYTLYICELIKESDI